MQSAVFLAVTLARLSLSERERIEVRDCCATVGERCPSSINSNAASVFSVSPG